MQNVWWWLGSAALWCRWVQHPWSGHLVIGVSWHAVKKGNGEIPGIHGHSGSSSVKERIRRGGDGRKCSRG